MEKLIEGLTKLVLRGRAAESQREVKADLSAAPACVKALAEAMASHSHNIELGEFSSYDDGSEGNLFHDLAGTIQMACEKGDLDPSVVGDFEAAKTLQLGADGGGMSYFGVSWSGGELGIVVVEFDDPTEDNLLKRFATPAQFLAFVDGRNRGKQFPDLEALR